MSVYTTAEHHVTIIAEVGINHNGNLEMAKKLIDLAHKAGCDVVKFQKRTIDLVYPKDVLDALRESPWGTTNRAQKEGLEFGREGYDEIDRHCKEIGIPWFASAWDLESLKFLDPYDCPYQKVASTMIVWEEFLRAVASRKKYTYISTGMCELSDVDRAVDIFRAAECPFELMHCVAMYPMEAADANLNCITTLRKRYRCDVGYSDHSAGLALSYAAVALGATSIERHITIDRSMYGSDQAASVERPGLEMLVGAIRKISLGLGDGQKRFLEKEKPIAKKLRVHLPTKAKGE